MTALRYLAGLFFATYALAFSSHADEPTKDTIASMKDYFAERSKDDLIFEYLNKPCFIEHVCTMGPIGNDPECETNLNYCLATVHQPMEPYQKSLYDKTCTSLFEKLTPEQDQIIAHPIVCDTPPSAKAMRPTMTTQEARCISQEYCKNIQDNGLNQGCVEDLLSCTNDMSGLTGGERTDCRGYRLFALRRDPPWLRQAASGICRNEMATPTLWGPDQAAVDHVDKIDWSNPPKTWQEQVERSQTLTDDEFIEDDLTF